jgi:hypothetical protein
MTIPWAKKVALYVCNLHAAGVLSITAKALLTILYSEVEEFAA